MSDRELAHLRDMLTQRMDASDQLVDERFASLKLALDLQAVELARRLDVLNGEAGRLSTMQASYVPREVYETRTKEIAKALEELRTFQAQSQGKGFAYAPFISIAVTVIGALIVFYLLQKR